MKKNGFTMVELIAIIIIISVILILSYSSLTKSLKDNDIREETNFVEKIENATKLYVETNLGNFKRLDEVGQYEIISASDLVDVGYLDASISNPTTSSLDEVFIKVYKGEDNVIMYTVYKSGDFRKYNDGDAVYFNPVLGRSCSNYTDANSANGIKNGCMKWYIFNDTKDAVSVNMILDHNTTSSLSWNSLDTNLTGPSDDMLNQLKKDTVTWVGVSRRKDNYSFDNGTASYVVDYTDYRARIITANEIAQISEYTSYNEKTSTVTSFFFGTNSSDTSQRGNYKWLYDRTSQDCTSNGCSYNSNADTYGYWTMTSLYQSSSDVFYVTPFGGIASAAAATSSIGIRPVITISKIILQ